MNQAYYITATDAFHDWREDVLTGDGPTLYRVGDGFDSVEVGPKLVTLVGGAPGAGKTALTMQWVVDALRVNTSLRAVTCNIEMPPETLLDRQVARLSGIDARTIRRRRLDSCHAGRIDAALNTLEEIAERLAFVRPPFHLSNVAATGDAFDAGLIVLDYIQRIPPPGAESDSRAAINSTMSFIRQFADAGLAVVVVSSVGRSKDSKGRASYAAKDLSLASFRESSELEFGADDAFILAPDGDGGDVVTLRHLKARHGEAKDLALRFDEPRQRFTLMSEGNPPRKPDAGKLQATMRDLWNSTSAAAEDEGADE